MNIVVLLFLLAVTIAFLFSYQQAIDILPFMGTVIFSLSFFKKDNRSLFARASIAGTSCWAAYAILSFSFAGFAYSAFVTISTIIGMARHENWSIGGCYKTFFPSIARSLFINPLSKPYILEKA